MKKALFFVALVVLVAFAQVAASMEENPTAIIDVRLVSNLRSPEGKTLQVWAFPGRQNLTGITRAVQTPQPNKEVVAKFQKVVSAFLDRGWKPFWGISMGQLCYEVFIDRWCGGPDFVKCVEVERLSIRGEVTSGESVYYDDHAYPGEVVKAVERLDRRASDTSGERTIKAGVKVKP